MSRFTIQLHDEGRCRIRHELADAEIITDRPPEYGGERRSFSCTDLVAAALGSCTLTSIDAILEREGYAPDKATVSVEKTISQSPAMLKAVRLEISYPEELSEKLLKKLERAAAVCPVKRSLSDQVEVEIRFRTGPVNPG